MDTKRKIKFIAWDKTKKIMLSVQTLEWRDDEEVMDVVTNIYQGSLSRFELMQFTGLKDKNGKEIYEGDVIGFKSDVRHLGKYLVEKNDEYSGFNPFCEGYYFQGKSYVDMFLDKTEIFGNIYENPELINDI